MHLATDIPTAEWSGEHIVISVPSGSAVIEIAISAAQGQRLARSIHDASNTAFEAHSKPLPRAEIIALAGRPRKRRKSRG